MSYVRAFLLIDRVEKYHDPMLYSYMEKDSEDGSSSSEDLMGPDWQGNIPGNLCFYTSIVNLLLFMSPRQSVLFGQIFDRYPILKHICYSKEFKTVEEASQALKNYLFEWIQEHDKEFYTSVALPTWDREDVRNTYRDPRLPGGMADELMVYIFSMAFPCFTLHVKSYVHGRLLKTYCYSSPEDYALKRVKLYIKNIDNLHFEEVVPTFFLGKFFY